MSQSTALETILTLIQARKNSDLATAISCYETEATIVLEPGKTGSGQATITAFITQVSSLSLSFSNHAIVISGDIALHTSSYVLDMGDKGKVAGRTADVLRLGTDGAWRIVIDNAWAAADAVQ